MIHVQIIRKQNTAVIIYGTNNIINASIKWKSSVLKWILVEQQDILKGKVNTEESMDQVEISL